MLKNNMSEVFKILFSEVEVGENSVHIKCSYSCEGHTFEEHFSLALPEQIEVQANVYIDAANLLAIAAATSYYKAFNSKHIVIDFPITEQVLKWATHLFDEGLREFRFQNQIDFKNTPEIKAEIRKSYYNGELPEHRKALIPIGGGKDSATTLAAMSRSDLNWVGFSVGSFTAIENCAKVAKIDMVRAIRTIDPQLFELNEQGVPNGHIPVTAINSTLAIIAALFSGAEAVVMSNEASANEPTRIVEGMEVNHQWSKSQEAEHLLSDAIKSMIANITYISLLRKLNEVEIFSIFSGLVKYHKAITSCNNAFKINENNRSRSWCGNCDKCRFVYLGLSAYLNASYVNEIFEKDLSADESQIQGFLNLINSASKPFECVGTINETKVLARRALQDYDFSISVVGKALEDVLKESDELSEKIRSYDNSKGILNVFNNPLSDLRKDIYNKRLQNIFIEKSIGVMGLGRDTSGMIRYLRKCGIKKEIKVYLPENNGISSSEFSQLLKKNNLQDVENLHMSNDLEEVGDIVFVSPGISKYSDEVRSLGARATTPVACWLDINKELLPTAIFIGVTGSKGKSTTASFMKTLLPHSLVAGNLGNAVGDIEIEELFRADYIVLEVSSFQASYVNNSPHVVALTSLFDSHIDWHLTPENYRADKLNLAAHGTIFTFMPSLLAEELGFSHEYEDNSNMSLLERNQRLALDVVQVVAPSLTQEYISEKTREFESLKYRQDVIKKIKGVTYISDVLSTAPAATKASVNDIILTHPNASIYLLYGGAERKVNDAILIEHLNSLKNKVKVLVLPDTGHKSETQLENVIHCNELADGVKYASENAKDGDVVLLAPGAPSFNRYESYEKLHEHFVELVNGLS